MLAFIIAAVALSRGLTSDEMAQLVNAVQIILTKKSLDPTTITPRQAYAVLSFALEAVLEQSRGSASGTPADPNSPPSLS
jgi:hypothetical protein